MFKNLCWSKKNVNNNLNPITNQLKVKSSNSLWVQSRLQLEKEQMEATARKKAVSLGSVCSFFLHFECSHVWPGFSSCSHSESAGRPGCWPRSSKHLLRCICDVEKTVGISESRVHVPHAGWHAGHGSVCHQEKQSLRGFQLDFIPEGRDTSGLEI